MDLKEYFLEIQAFILVLVNTEDVGEIGQGSILMFFVSICRFFTSLMAKTNFPKTAFGLNEVKIRFNRYD